MAPEAGLFIVADGMGGHAAGDVAARLAVSEVRAALTSDVSFHILERYVASPDLSARRNVFARIRRAVERANQALLDDARDNEERRGMGSTIDLLWLVRNHAFVGHAGDGRVYLARRRAVLQLTQDHGALEALKASGQARPARKAQRNALLNAVGLKESVTVDTLFVDLHKGDRLLLCSDGVHGQVSSESRLAELIRGGSVKDAAGALVKEAGRKGRDNATAIVVEIGERFVKRPSAEQGLLSKDIERASQCALLHGLGPSLALAALSASVEIEYAAEHTIPRVVANDMVAYIVLEGTIDLEDGLTVGEGAVLFPE
jgi:serine/threonine protein phosphatase PrpC